MSYASYLLKNSNKDERFRSMTETKHTSNPNHGHLSGDHGKQC
jgi:hypothetical protein